MKTKRQIVTAFRREAILDAARKVFAHQGFAGGIVDEIAAEAGMAKGTVYLYFKSKRDIYKALLDHDMEVVKANAVAGVKAGTTLKAKIRAFALARLENAELNREVFRMMDTQPGAPGFTRAQYREWVREPVMLLAEAIEKAKQAGEVREIEAGKAAWAVADLVRGTIQRRLLGQTELALDAEADFVADLMYSALSAKK
ncbi:MAG: TetR/AcrR family transcriptional regulator [Terracidiphilus sp.]